MDDVQSLVRVQREYAARCAPVLAGKRIEGDGVFVFALGSCLDRISCITCTTQVDDYLRAGRDRKEVDFSIDDKILQVWHSREGSLSTSVRYCTWKVRGCRHWLDVSPQALGKA